MDKLGSKTIIGAGATFIGKIANARVIEVHGKVNADLTAEKVTIGEDGHFDGAICAELVVVSGHYEGQDAGWQRLGHGNSVNFWQIALRNIADGSWRGA